MINGENQAIGIGGGRGYYQTLHVERFIWIMGLVFVKPNPNQLLPPERSGGGAYSKASNKQGILCRGDEQPDVPFSIESPYDLHPHSQDTESHAPTERTYSPP